MVSLSLVGTMATVLLMQMVKIRHIHDNREGYGVERIDDESRLSRARSKGHTPSTHDLNVQADVELGSPRTSPVSSPDDGTSRPPIFAAPSPFTLDLEHLVVDVARHHRAPAHLRCPRTMPSGGGGLPQPHESRRVCSIRADEVGGGLKSNLFSDATQEMKFVAKLVPIHAIFNITCCARSRA